MIFAGFKDKAYLSFFLVLIVIIVLFSVILSKQSTTPAKFNCQDIDVYQDKNYLVPYSFFLLKYIGFDSNASQEVLKAINFEINKGALFEDSNAAGFDMEVVNALYSGQETKNNGKLCVYDVSLISTKDLDAIKPIKANEKLINMYWLVSVDGNTSKVLNSLILESFG